jgi:hypothetical protein
MPTKPTKSQIILPIILLLIIYVVILGLASFQVRHKQVLYNDLIENINHNRGLIEEINSLRKQKELTLLSFSITRDPTLLSEIDNLTRRTDQALDTINQERLNPQENKLLQTFIAYRQELQVIESQYIETILNRSSRDAESNFETWRIKNQLLTAVLVDLNNINAEVIAHNLGSVENNQNRIKSFLGGGIVLLIMLSIFSINYYRHLFGLD